MTLGESEGYLGVEKKILTSLRWKSLSVPSSLDLQPFVLSKKVVFDWIDLILFILFEKLDPRLSRLGSSL